MLDDRSEEPALDLRHIGRFFDKELPIEAAGMEMGKPGLPDLRRRKSTVPVNPGEDDGRPDNPPQTAR